LSHHLGVVFQQFDRQPAAVVSDLHAAGLPDGAFQFFDFLFQDVSVIDFETAFPLCG
jgi:hypothetical protein